MASTKQVTTDALINDGINDVLDALNVGEEVLADEFQGISRKTLQFDPVDVDRASTIVSGLDEVLSINSQRVQALAVGLLLVQVGRRLCGNDVIGDLNESDSMSLAMWMIARELSRPNVEDEDDIIEDDENDEADATAYHAVEAAQAARRNQSLQVQIAARFREISEEIRDDYEDFADELMVLADETMRRPVIEDDFDDDEIPTPDEPRHLNEGSETPSSRVTPPDPKPVTLDDVPVQEREGFVNDHES